jgi:H/ACA ribonucleoprotein complex subunit 4
MLILQEYQSKLGCMPEERTIEEHLKYGIAIINKPIGPTSHEVASFVRKILHLQVVGHTGTLDFNVSGVLVVLLENSRKVTNYIENSDKKYVCLMRTSKKFGREKLTSAFSNFKGKIFQKPPIASAVARKLRVRRIISINILETRENLVLFECKCEAGTYIRKIVSDLGEVLGAKSEMLELRRTDAGLFTEKDAVSLQQLSDYYLLWKEKGEEKYIRKAVFPIEKLQFKKIFVTDESALKFKTGIKPKIGEVVKLDAGIGKNEFVGAYTGKGELIAICQSSLTSSEIEYGHKNGKLQEIAAHIVRIIHPF